MIVYSSTEPVQGDTYRTLLGKLCQAVGATPEVNDSEYNLVWKILEAVNSP